MEWTPDRTQAALDAEIQLLTVERAEEIAVLWETETIDSWRHRFAEQYRDWAGVHPALRTEFRAALTRVANGGGVPVAELIDYYRRVAHVHKLM